MNRHLILKFIYRLLSFYRLNTVVNLFPRIHFTSVFDINVRRLKLNLNQ